MALYHLHADIIGRSKGKSAVGSACYQLRANGVDETTGVRLSYSRKQDKPLLFGMMQPDGSPFHAASKKDCIEFWNELSKQEKRKDAQYARDFDIALQAELTPEQNADCLREWIEKFWTGRGCAAQYAVHGPHIDDNGKSNNNIHAHVMVSIRTISADGWGKKDRDGNDTKFMKDCRKGWADIVNAKFQELGIAARIDERTLKEQGQDRAAQTHRGTAATAMQRRGKETDRTGGAQTLPTAAAVVVSDAEVDAALRADDEYKRLVELLNIARGAENRQSREAAAELQRWEDRIRAMTPAEWEEFTRHSDGPLTHYVDEALGEYARTLKSSYRAAKEKWIEQNIAPVTKCFEKTYQDEKAALDAYDATEPTPIADRPGKIHAILYEYHTDDGEVFPGRRFDEYRVKQQNIINDWQQKRAEPAGRLKVAEDELQACYDQDYSAVRVAIDDHYPTLSERMADGAAELFRKLKEFRPVRAMMQAVKNWRARKDEQLQSWNQERQRAAEIARQTNKNGPKIDYTGHSM